MVDEIEDTEMETQQVIPIDQQKLGILDAFKANRDAIQEKKQDFGLLEKREALTRAVQRLGGKVDEEYLIKLAVQQNLAERLSTAVEKGDDREIQSILAVLQTTPVVKR